MKTSDELKLGASVMLRFSDQPDYNPIGVIRELSPRKITVWFGHTGFGQRRWDFSRADGAPLGWTKEVFPTSKLDLSWKGC